VFYEDLVQSWAGGGVRAPFTPSETVFPLPYGRKHAHGILERLAGVAIGGGDYGRLAHSDDVDLGFRLRRLGRIVYDPRLFVRLSVRRLEKQGYMRTLLVWLRGDLKALAGLPIEPTEYARQKY